MSLLGVLSALGTLSQLSFATPYGLDGDAKLESSIEMLEAVRRATKGASPSVAFLVYDDGWKLLERAKESEGTLTLQADVTMVVETFGLPPKLAHQFLVEHGYYKPDWEQDLVDVGIEAQSNSVFLPSPKKLSDSKGREDIRLIVYHKLSKDEVIRRIDGISSEVAPALRDLLERHGTLSVYFMNSDASEYFGGLSFMEIEGSVFESRAKFLRIIMQSIGVKGPATTGIASNLSKPNAPGYWTPFDLCVTKVAYPTASDNMLVQQILYGEDAPALRLLTSYCEIRE